MSLENFLLVVAVILSVLLVISLPLLWQAWRAVRNAAVALEALNKSLPAILKNVEEITSNLNHSTTAINREVQNLAAVLSRFYAATSGIIGDIRGISPAAVKTSLLQLASSGWAILKGLRVFLDVFLRRR